MLVLTRREGERILIGPDIAITVVSAEPGRVRLGVEAPNDVAIDREEVRTLKERSVDGKGGSRAKP